VISSPVANRKRQAESSASPSKYDVGDEFRRTYADAIDPINTESDRVQACRRRRLVWKSTERVSLKTAAAMYGAIAGYNAFRPGMIESLHRAFPNENITVTPAREYSVAILLHIPDCNSLRERVEGFVRDRFMADEITWEAPETLRVWWD